MIGSAARWFGMFVAVVLLACGGSDKSDRLPDGGSAGPGLGDSNARPAGRAYALPTGIALDGGIDATDDRCFDRELVGDGSLVSLCVALRNTTAGAITVTLPPGLVFVSGSLEFQNGILLQEVAIEVPGGEVVIVQLGTHCVNLGRHIPDASAAYELGPITQQAQLLEIASIIAGKTLDWGGRYTVQNAVWNVTDFGGLTAEDRAALAAL